MPNIPLFGLGSGRKSPNVSTQARINCYVEKLAEPDKAPLAIYARPGFAHIVCDAPTTPPFGGPTRGMICIQTNNGLPVPPYDVLFTVNGGGVNHYPSLITVDGPTPTNPFQGTGPVRMAFDGNSIVAVDGVYGYQITVPSGLSYKNPDVNFPQGARTVCCLGGYFFCDDPTVGGRFRWSDQYAGYSWPPLNYATAQQNPDPLTGVFEAHGQLLLFGTRTLEFWNLQPSGFANTQPVTAVPGSTMMWGTEAYDTIRKVGDQVAFMGRNNNGDRKVILLNGYTPTVISTPDIEADIQAAVSPDAAVALVTGKAGHTFYVLNLQTVSWAYDLESGNWDIWQTEGARFAGQWSAAAFGQLVMSDYRDSRLHTVDVNLLTDDGAMMTRELNSRHLFGPDLERLPISELTIDLQTGVGLVTGQGSDPLLMASWSKDGGHTYGNEIQMPIGRMGHYLRRAVLRFLGCARDWNFRLRITDPVTLVVIGANAKLGP